LRAKVHEGRRFIFTDKSPEELAYIILNHECEFKLCIQEVLRHLGPRLQDFDAVASPEAKGFSVGQVIAYTTHKPFIPIRKWSRIIGKKGVVSYNYHYGRGELFLPVEIEKGQVVIIAEDDVISGGTSSACCEVLNFAGAEVIEVVSLIEWPQFRGRKRLQKLGVELFSAWKAFKI
jgi:adenine phosphoribosyltransferase